ncbi:MAG TPA: ATP-binding protein [Terriglobia bacterium]|nr:ATP-binding protein [Terriglobia bacterium]
MISSDFEILLPPKAAVLLESMRAIGYSFETALADIIDNSISAEATNVQVGFSPYDVPYVAVIDNGTGMSAEQLVCAMRHGSQDPKIKRSGKDLGRFGLGLKTASLSQCRCLTVASIQRGSLNARRWDLDLVEQRGDWILTGLRSQELSTLPCLDVLKSQQHGTLVVWQRFDRLAAGESSIEVALGERIDRAREHLALVFHRLLSSEKGVCALTICINNNPVDPLDPFLISHRATQALPEERLEIEGQLVRVAPYILPHISKLSPEQLRIAGGEDGLRRKQGFYIYRNRRLISWGSWFRLIRPQEMTKLARVLVDIPNSLDHLWTLDIKKSTAFPPEAIRTGLRLIVERIAETSRRVYTFRGRRANDDEMVHCWDRKLVRGGVSYFVNREHPVVSALGSVIPEEHVPLFERLLQTIEGTFPFDSLYADMASERRPETVPDNESVNEYLYELGARILDALGTNEEAASRFVRNLASIEPFCRYPAEVTKIAEKLQHVHRERTTH